MVPLPAQPATRLTKPKTAPEVLALIQQLAATEPRPTARAIHRQLLERGVRVGLRTVQTYAAVAPAKRGRPANA